MNTKKKRDIYIQHIQQSIQNALVGKSSITQDILAIPGMSSSLVRHFLNNVCSLPATRYLEIGCWQGSTLISALCGNQQSLVSAVAIDNWSLCPQAHIKEKFLGNVALYLQNYPVHFFNEDCFTINPQIILQQPITVYFYDGQHSSLAHEKAFTHFNTIFDDTFIAIIDDWNWTRVRRGTLIAFTKLNYTIEYQQEFFTEGNDAQDWWNGLCIVVLSQ